MELTDFVCFPAVSGTAVVFVVCIQVLFDIEENTNKQCLRLYGHEAHKNPCCTFPQHIYLIFVTLCLRLTDRHLYWIFRSLWGRASHILR